MISYLEGKIVLKKEKFIILNVSGVGFKVFLSPKTFLKIPEIGQTIKIFCFLEVKERGLELYGFLDYKELEFFEIVNDISGIGPKIALGISSLGPLEEIKEKILAQEEKIFDGIPGIGKKRAMTIILELSGMIRNISKEKVSGGDEVEDTLVGLGFSKQKAKEVISKIPKDIKDPQEKIKIALQMLGRE